MVGDDERRRVDVGRRPSPFFGPCHCVVELVIFVASVVGAAVAKTPDNNWPQLLRQITTVYLTLLYLT